MISKKILKTHPVPVLPKNCKRNAGKVVNAERVIIQDTDVLVLYVYSRDLELYRLFLTKDDYLTQCIDTGKWYTGSLCNMMMAYKLRTSRKCETIITKVLKEWGTPVPSSERWYLSTAIAQIVDYQEKIMADRYKKRIKKEAEMIDKEMAEFPKEPKRLYEFLYRDVYKNANFVVYNKKEKTAYCTHCEADVPFSKLKGTVKHKGEGICPNCKRPVTFMSDGMSHKYLVSYGTGVVIQRKGRNIYIRYYDTYKKFKDYKFPLFSYREVVRTVIKDGEIMHYEWDTFHGGAPRWNKRKITISYYGILYGINYEPHGNYAFSSLNVRGTDCEYSALKQFMDNSSLKGACLPEKYLNKWLDNKSLEKLTKVGFYRLADAIVSGDTYITKMKGDGSGRRVSVFNEDEKELYKILNVTKEQYKILAEYGNPTVRFYLTVAANTSANRYVLDDYVFVDENAGCQRKSFFEIVNEIPFSFAKIKKYLSGFESTEKAVNWFIDYIKFCKELGYDITNEFVVFPKDLKTAHDQVSEAAKWKQNEENINKVASQLPLLHDMYDFSYKDLMITAPIHSAGEIITEGQTLHHCVGGYLSRVANGSTTILFVRKKNAPEKPFYTLEVNNGLVVQCRGKCNCQMTEEVKEAVEAFQREKLSKLAVAG